ncbi:MAG TPA: Fe-S cluster assembly protein SufD [Candidatus Binatia bacterium]|nr:Fe-S cluster assembly protein SufD [Candidatus Binatia bacterium]
MNTAGDIMREHERVRGSLSGRGAGWLDALRTRGLARVAEAGFPTVRNEDWKYTNVSQVLKSALRPILADQVRIEDAALHAIVAGLPGVGEDSPLLVFVDGHFQSRASRLGKTHRGLSIGSLRERLEREPASLQPWLGKYLPVDVHGFVAFNTAFLDDGAVVEIGEGAIIETPIHVLFHSTSRAEPFVTNPRNVIVAGAGSSALVVEHYVGAAGARHLTNAATEIAVGRDAALGHVRIQREAETAFHVGRVQVDQEAGSSLTSHSFGFGAALSRVELPVRLAGEDAECAMHGLWALHGTQHADHHLWIDHASPRTRSRQTYKGVLEDSARGVFTGKVLVRPGAQKIEARQSNANLVLGQGAVAETRPQLEIYADDVQCTHGASIGRLDEDALFYIQQRGIDAREARRLLVYGFAIEVAESVVPEPLRQGLMAAVAQRVASLARQGEGQ